jgi:cell wall-associated NlpC family hydrolase
MLRLIKLIFVIIILFTQLLIVNCSSSSYTDRYNKPKPKVETKKTKTERFSSKDDPNPTVEKDETETNKVYSNPSNQSEFDEEPIEDYPVDKESFVKNYKHLEKINIALTTREKILFEVIRYLDTPYQFGGNGLNGIDCSAFTQNVFNKSINFNLPRTARDQYKMGTRVNRSSLEFGDLIFFDTRREAYPGHVGIYIGEDKFAHASSSLGVTISSLQSTYYKTRFIGGKRVLLQE